MKKPGLLVFYCSATNYHKFSRYYFRVLQIRNLNTSYVSPAQGLARLPSRCWLERQSHLRLFQPPCLLIDFISVVAGVRRHSLHMAPFENPCPQHGQFTPARPRSTQAASCLLPSLDHLWKGSSVLAGIYVLWIIKSQIIRDFTSEKSFHLCCITQPAMTLNSYHIHSLAHIEMEVIIQGESTGSQEYWELP